MIVGAVNDRLEAILSLELNGSVGRSHSVAAVIDTGFSGYLTLPPGLTQTLALPRVGRGAAALADGSVVSFDVYQAVIDWDGQARTIQVDEADTTPLLGMAMLDGHDLHLEVAAGGRVTIERRV